MLEHNRAAESAFNTAQYFRTEMKLCKNFCVNDSENLDAQVKEYLKLQGVFYAII